LLLPPLRSLPETCLPMQFHWPTAPCRLIECVGNGVARYVQHTWRGGRRSAAVDLNNLIWFNANIILSNSCAICSTLETRPHPSLWKRLPL
jgi:hypothetical protein